MMICPACGVCVRIDFEPRGVVRVEDERSQHGYDIADGFCPACEHHIIVLRYGRYHDNAPEWRCEIGAPDRYEIIWPRGGVARRPPAEVPSEIAVDYSEASAVLPISPKASAAISRRLLQIVLREKFEIKKPSLAQEIEAFIQSPGVPTTLSDAVDAVRNVGNFAAHPIKDTNTGEVIPVEPGEAEWLLDVLESLFDFAYVQPERIKANKAKLNAKLQAAGKPSMK